MPREEERRLMPRRTVVHAFDFGGLGPGSFVPSLVALGRALQARGDRFVALGRRVPGAAWPALLRAAGLDLDLSEDGDGVLRALAALQPDIVHTHFTSFDLGALRVAPASRVFWHVHSVRDERASTPPARARAFVKYGLLGRRVRAVLVPSQSLAGEAARWFVPRAKLRIVPNGVDTAHFRPPSYAERAAARIAYGIAETDAVVLFFERIPIKGGDVLRAALADVPHVRLLVAGGSHAMRARFGESPRVISIDYEPDVRRLYWAADALAFPSRREAFGFVLVEALACGLPVAAGDIGPVREIAGDLDGVAIAPDGDARGFAAALRRALTFGRGAAAAAVAERYGLDRFTADILRVYDERG